MTTDFVRDILVEAWMSLEKSPEQIEMSTACEFEKLARSKLSDYEIGINKKNEIILNFSKDDIYFLPVVNGFYFSACEI